MVSQEGLFPTLLIVFIAELFPNTCNPKVIESSIYG